MISITFASGSRAVCPSCRRPLWRCVCRLAYSLLLNYDNFDALDRDADVTDTHALTLFTAHERPLEIEADFQSHIPQIPRC
jgi:hypothetical protein